MPKYHFKCNDCTRVWWEWMSISKCDHDECPHCKKGPPQKIPVGFATGAVNGDTKKQTGEVVEQSIIDSREELKKEIKKMRNKTYDNT